MAMATSATTTTTSATAGTYLCREHLVVGRRCSNNYISFMRKSARRFCVKSSTDDLPSSSAATTQVEETDESQIEVPKGPSSLISALNVEKALHGIAITDADYYGILGLKKGCPYDQVKAAYDIKLEELMKQEELTKKLDLLKESYSILSSVEERRLYDWSLARNENPDRYAWFSWFSGLIPNIYKYSEIKTLKPTCSTGKAVGFLCRWSRDRNPPLPISFIKALLFFKEA